LESHFLRRRRRGETLSPPRYFARRLFRTFARRRAADCPAGATREWSTIVRAIVFGIKMTAGGCFVELGDDRIAVAFVAAG